MLEEHLRMGCPVVSSATFTRRPPAQKEREDEKEFEEVDWRRRCRRCRRGSRRSYQAPAPPSG